MCSLTIIFLTLYLDDYLLFFLYSDVRTILISARKKQHKGQTGIHYGEYKQSEASALYKYVAYRH